MTQPTRATRSDATRILVTRFLHKLGRLLVSPERLLTVLAFVIGTVTGLGAIGFSLLIDVMTRLYYEQIGDSLRQRELFLWLLPLLPASAGLLVGLITTYFAPEAEGHGVPEVMDAMIRKGGRIRPRVAGAKAVASALTIGSGGSAGTEGPIIQIGAAIGSGFGQWLRCSLNDIRVLIGCGAAAGIAAIFNAPIAGVLFSVEVLLRDVSLRSFVPIIIASVLSTTVVQAYKGESEALFPVPQQVTGQTAEPVYQFTVPEMGNYVLLGLVCGLVAVTFVKALYATEDLFRKLPVHRVLKPVIGALLLGLLTIGTLALIDDAIPPPPAHRTVMRGEGLPAIMGNGYPIIDRTLAPESYAVPGGWQVRVLLVLLVAKVLATCLTLGSGGSGGVFAPSLFMGATAGGAFGLLMQHVPGFAGVSPGAYALVGMAAVVAASIHAPLTATLMLFELTRDYKVILPIMAAGVTALAVARWIEPASIYTMKLLRRGIGLGSSELRMLQRISAREIPRITAPVVRPEDPIDKVVRLMRTSTANDFVVVDRNGRLAGMVLGDDLRTILLESEAVPLLNVSDVLRGDIPTVRPDDTLDTILEKFSQAPVQALPVLSERDGGAHELLTRAAVMNRYQQALSEASGKRGRRVRGEESES